MFLYGFGPVLLAGTIQTIELSVLSLAASVVLGLLGAAAKLSLHRLAARDRHRLHDADPLRARSRADAAAVLQHPDLAEQSHRRCSAGTQIDIDPFVAGVLDARLHLRRVLHRDLPRRVSRRAARPARSGRGVRHERRAQVFTRILFPQMMRFALPGIGNNWQVLVKATALVSIIGLADVVKASQDAGKSTLRLVLLHPGRGARSISRSRPCRTSC